MFGKLHISSVHSKFNSHQSPAYQKAAGIDVNWTKLSEEQYDGFIQWSRDEADRMASEDKEKGDKEGSDKAAKAKAKAAKDFNAWYDKGIEIVHAYVDAYPEKRAETKHDLMELTDLSDTMNSVLT